MTAVPGKDPAQIEGLCNQEIERIVREGVSDEELERVRMAAIRNRALTLVSTDVRSVMLARLEAYTGHPDEINKWEDDEHHLSSASLQRVAKRYLTPANRVVVRVTPAGVQ